MQTADDLQHLAIKIFATNHSLDLTPVVPVFHRWIQESNDSDRLLDVADYRHVQDGPGVLLVAFDAHYGLDTQGGRVGLTYTRKSVVDGSPVERVMAALVAALGACARIEAETSLGVTFDAGDIEVGVNDRHLAPNTEATEQVLRPLIEQALKALVPDAAFTIGRVGEPRDLFKLRAKASAMLAVSAVKVA